MPFLRTDVPDLRGYDTGLVLSNLAGLTGRQIALSESRLAQLYELAEAVLHDAGDDPDVVDSILLSLQDEGEGEESDGSLSSSDARPGPSDADPSDRMPLDPAVRAALTLASPSDRPLLLQLCGSAGLTDRLLLYRFLCELTAARAPAEHPHARSHGSRAPFSASPAGSDPMNFSLPASLPSVSRDGDPEGSRRGGGRVAYMKGTFADRVFLRFSELLPGCRAATFTSFVDACEEVYNGLCEFCILPLEGSAEGKLTAFSGLIVKYELTTVAACDLRNRAVSGQPVTRFGLLCRRSAAEQVSAWICGRASGGGSVRVPDCMELLHVTGGSPSLSDLLRAAEICGMRLLRVDTLPLAEVSDAPEDSPPPPAARDLTSRRSLRIGGSAETPLCVVLDTSSATPKDLLTFSRFLSLEAPEDVVMGHYVLL